jgi:hypothetical protein
MSDEASFTIAIDAEGNAKRIAEESGEALEGLRAKALASQEALKTAGAALRSLRGNSTEVKTAQEQLRAVMDKQRASLSSANLEILKQKTSLTDLNKAAEARAKTAAKAAADAQKEKEENEGLNNGLLRLFGVSREARTALGELSSGINVAQVATAGLIGGTLALAAAVAAAGAAIVLGTYALAKWVLTAGDANRSLALSRQWIAGSAEDTARMGDQIDRLRQKIPLTTDELSKLYTETRSALDGARVSGQSILDVVEAVGTASGAGADKAASKIRELAERNKNLGRFQLNLGAGFGANAKGELGGTGLDANDVAKHLAENTKVSLATARAELQRGTVSYVEGIKALKQTAETAFGEINAKKLLSLDSISKRLHDDWSALTKGVNLEPFLTALSRVEHVFSTSTTSGRALQGIITAFGTLLGGVATAGAPKLESALRQLVLWTTRLAIRVVDMAIIWKQTWTADDVQSWGQKAIDVLDEVVLNVRILSTMWGQLTSAISTVNDVLDPAGAKLREFQAQDQASATARQQAGTFTRTSVAPAHAEGGTVMKPAPGEVFASVAPGEQIVPVGGFRGGGGGGGGRSAAPILNVTINVNGGGGNTPAATAAAVRSILPEFTKVVEDLCKSQGIPTQTGGT